MTFCCASIRNEKASAGGNLGAFIMSLGACKIPGGEVGKTFILLYFVCLGKWGVIARQRIPGGVTQTDLTWRSPARKNEIQPSGRICQRPGPVGIKRSNSPRIALSVTTPYSRRSAGCGFAGAIARRRLPVVRPLPCSPSIPKRSLPVAGSAFPRLSKKDRSTQLRVLLSFTD